MSTTLPYFLIFFFFKKTSRLQLYLMTDLNRKVIINNVPKSFILKLGLKKFMVYEYLTNTYMRITCEVIIIGEFRRKCDEAGYYYHM